MLSSALSQVVVQAHTMPSASTPLARIVSGTGRSESMRLATQKLYAEQEAIPRIVRRNATDRMKFAQ